MSIALKQRFTCEKQKKKINHALCAIMSHLKLCLGIEVPSNHRWNECAICCLETRKGACYAFNDMCYHREIKSWVVKKYLLTLW